MPRRRRISKVSLLALVVITTVAATGLATVMADLTDPAREPNERAAVSLHTVDADADRLVLAHRSGEPLRATDHVLTVSVGDDTLRWDGAAARGHVLDADGRVVVDLSSGRVWWGADASPTWRRSNAAVDLSLEPGDTVRVRVVSRAADLPVVDVSATV